MGLRSADDTAGLLKATTQMLAWSLVAFFASGASSAYLTVSESAAVARRVNKPRAKLV